MKLWTQQNRAVRRAFKAIAAVLAVAVLAVLAVAVLASKGLPVATTLGVLALLPLARVTVTELSERRAKMLTDARGLVDAAEDAKRSLSPDEAGRADKLLADAEKLKADIERVKRLEGGESDLGQSRGRRAAPNDLPGGGGTQETASRWVNADSGEELRVFAPGDRMAPDVAADQLDLGLMIRGMACGKWAGADRERRALSEGLGTAGAYAVPEPLAGYILDVARAQSVCIAAGMATVQMEADTLQIARVTADPTASWRAENAEIAESEPTFGSFKLTATSLGVFCKVSQELVADAPNVGQVVEETLAKACGLALDYACLMGTGALEPMGIYNDSDVQELTSIGVPDIDDFIDAVTAVREENHEPNAAVLHPTYWGLMDKMKYGDGYYVVPGPPAYANLKHLGSTQIPKTLGGGAESVGFVGDFTKLLLGVRQSVTLEASREASDSTSSAFRNVQIWIRAILRADVCISYEKAFCILRGLSES